MLAVVVLVNVSLTGNVPLEAGWLMPVTNARLHENVDPGIALAGE